MIYERRAWEDLCLYNERVLVYECRWCNWHVRIFRKWPVSKWKMALWVDTKKKDGFVKFRLSFPWTLSKRKAREIDWKTSHCVERRVERRVWNLQTPKQAKDIIYVCNLWIQNSGPYSVFSEDFSNFVQLCYFFIHMPCLFRCHRNLSLQLIAKYLSLTRFYK